nr:MAG TPA: hypothetical protein [Crassvirales sp.]
MKISCKDNLFFGKMQIFEEIFEIEMEMWGDGKMRMGTYDHTTIANIPPETLEDALSPH